jgi:hypothetical protein
MVFPTSSEGQNNTLSNRITKNCAANLSTQKKKERKSKSHLLLKLRQQQKGEILLYLCEANLVPF